MFWPRAKSRMIYFDNCCPRCSFQISSIFMNNKGVEKAKMVIFLISPLWHWPLNIQCHLLELDLENLASNVARNVWLRSNHVWQEHVCPFVMKWHLYAFYVLTSVTLTLYLRPRAKSRTIYFLEYVHIKLGQYSFTLKGSNGPKRNFLYSTPVTLTFELSMSSFYLTRRTLPAMLLPSLRLTPFESVCHDMQFMCILCFDLCHLDFRWPWAQSRMIYFDNCCHQCSYQISSIFI